MKRSILLALCLSVVSVFAGYDINEFSATDTGSPDQYISAEFGGELKTIPADEVESLQDGRLVVRLKFEDAFGEGDASYQLYQGVAGNVSSMAPLTAEDYVDYSKLITAKMYDSEYDDEGKDIEKVYFDGKSVYVPGHTTVVAYVDGSPVTLKGEAPAAEEESAPAPVAAASSNDDECEDYDEDCDDDEDLSAYRTSAPVDNTSADSRDYAANSASESATDRFGIADEVRFWSAVGLSALAVTSIVIGVMQHSKANEAKDAYDELNDLNNSLLKVCEGNKACESAMSQNASNSNGTWTLENLQARIKENKKIQDSYASARNIWFGVAGLSIAGAVTLFVW